MPRDLGVKEAALSLGVHPQTVRAWTSRGILVAMRLPGSRYRRYSVDEIERVRRAMRLDTGSAEPFGPDDALLRLSGAFESGASRTVAFLHREIAEAIDRRRERPRTAGSRLRSARGRGTASRS